MTAGVRIEKLSLTSTAIGGVDVVALISSLPHLKSLALGALGGGQGSSVSIGNTSAMTMTDQMLESLTDVLKDLEQLEKISLVGNTKLGITSRDDSALQYFIQRVGRKCKVRLPTCISTTSCLSSVSAPQSGRCALSTIPASRWSLAANRAREPTQARAAHSQ